MEELAINEWIDGSLLTPEDNSKSVLAIIIAGSGPTNRDGNQNFLKSNSLKKLAEGLSNQGITTFRYDKRIVKQIRKGKVDNNMMFDDFVTDAISVIEYFKEENNFSKIYVIGHSQGSLVGMLAAKEFGEHELFGELRNSIDKVGDLTVDQVSGGLVYDHPENRMINGVVLASKLHLGWSTVLGHDWGFEGIHYTVPDTTDMTWTDLLPQRVYAHNGEGGLPLNSDMRPCPNCFWGDYASQRMKFNAEQTKVKEGPACSASSSSSCGLKNLLAE